jgi:SAM-dependent methyltransferase
MSGSSAGVPVPRELERGAYVDRDDWLDSARFAVALLARTLGREDLAGIDLLDVGCGTKVVKILLDDSLPIGHYAGIDVAPEVIEWLRANVSDPRFEFHHLDAHNALYNPHGKPLESFDLLPVGSRQFDLICLFSVFTHLAPPDFGAMLRLLRSHIQPDGKLLFSLYVNRPDRPTEIERAVREGLASGDPEVRARLEAAIEKAHRHAAASPYDPRFTDEVPDQPLLIARYRCDYVLELFEDTGWDIEASHPPERYIQDYVICRPA